MDNKIVPGIPRWQNEKTETKKFMERVDDIKYEGEEKLEVRVETQFVESMGPAFPGEVFPESGKPGFFNFWANWKKTVGRLIWDGETVDLKVAKKRFFDNVKRAVSGFLTAMALDEDYYLCGNGTGKLGQAADVPTVQTVSVFDARAFREGMNLMGVNLSTNAIVCENCWVDAVDVLQKTIRFKSTANLSGVDVNTSFFKQGVYTPGFNKCIMGLGGHISNVNPPCGSYQETDRSLYPIMNAVVCQDPLANNRDIEDTWFQTVYFGCINGRAGTFPEHGMMCPEMNATFVDWLKSQNQPIESFPARGGWPAGLKYTFNGKEVPIHTMRFAPSNEINFIDPSSLLFYDGGGSFWKHHGSTLIPLNDTHGYQQIWISYKELVCMQPNKNAKIIHLNQKSLPLN